MRLAISLAILLISQLSPSIILAKTDQFTKLLLHERALLVSLEDLSEKVIEKCTIVEDLVYQQQQIDYQISEIERRIQSLSKRVGQIRKTAGQRVRNLYKLSQGGLARLILEENSQKNIFQKARVINRIVKTDIEELNSLRLELAELQTSKQEILRQKEKSQKIKALLKNEHQSLAMDQHRLKQIIKEAEKNRRLQLTAKQEFTPQHKKLLSDIAAQKERINNAGGLWASKGNLKSPVQGSIVGKFGKVVEPKKRLQVARNGITYKSSPRSNVYALANGVVRVVRPVKGHGTVVLVDHGKGFHSLYGFLASALVKEGTYIQRRNILGTTGTDPVTGESGLYLEMRHHTRPLDPTDWIRR